jgi:hypothetical protein
MSKFDLTHPDSMAENALAHLQAVLSTSHLDQAVDRYYDHRFGFAGYSFEPLNDDHTDEITSEDLLAVTLLDVSWKPSAVRALLDEKAEKVSELLHNVNSKATLWSDDGGRELVNAEPLWEFVMELPGVGPTTTSKLLARKRPGLVPITDSVIVSAVGTSGRTWSTLRYCFQDPDFRQLVDTLRPDGANSVSLLRIFDVAIWMLYSESTAARKVRADVGIADQL